MNGEEKRHPFLTGLSKHRGSPPTILIIFGASGDLTSRKLLPAVYNLSVDNLLPNNFHFIGFGRKEIEMEKFSSQMKEGVEQHSRRELSEEYWNNIQENIHYSYGDYDSEEAFIKLKKKIDEIQEKDGIVYNTLFYISTPPNVFSSILSNLGKTGLAKREANGELLTRVIIEKPFGKNLETAQKLNKIISKHLEESQVYRIDHYLGKETVQNLLVQRFANAIFEPVWNREYVECVQITVAESLGVGTRAGYYDTSGALRDMIQNHTMQLLALTAMEPPVSLSPESIRDEKVKVLQAIQPLCMGSETCGNCAGDSACNVVRARYSKGHATGEEANAYLEEDGVPEDSSTETYAALALQINNWRWQGVPFYLRSGKRLPKRVTEISIHFKRPPGVLFAGDDNLDLMPNVLAIQVQPDEGISLAVNSKVPGLQTRTQPVKMHFRYKTTFGSNTPEAYERLILDAIIGDGTLFIRGDETEASWKLITPILECWEKNGNLGMEEYPAGSWGPRGADKMLNKNSHNWRCP